MLVDSHCHLNYPELKENTAEVLKKAKEFGVQLFLTVNTKLDEYPYLKSLTAKYSEVFCSIGVHPHDAQDHDLKNLYQNLKSGVQHRKTVALGETGLDYYYNNSPKKEQLESFKIHCEVSKETNTPLIIHTRDADEDTIATLKPFQSNINGVFHCFSGGIDFAKKALNLGFYISFSGIITFKKALELQEVVKYIPIDRILVETDSPFLAPIPYRGKPNQPAYTKFVAEKIAELKNIPFDKVTQNTTENFFKLFHKTKSFQKN